MTYDFAHYHDLDKCLLRLCNGANNMLFSSHYSFAEKKPHFILVLVGFLSNFQKNPTVNGTRVQMCNSTNDNLQAF